MGHVLNKILKDIANRYHLSQGKRVIYKPGWDTHGLPIEVKVTSSLTAKDRDPLFVRQAAKKYAENEMRGQLESFKLLGILADWTNIYKTFDSEYEHRQLEIFAEMVRKGLVYRAHRPIHWSPANKTALADAELEYNDNHISRSAYVKFKVTEAGLPLLDNITNLNVREAVQRGELRAVIWTTTPWSLPANVALAVNADLSYSIVRHPSHGLLLLATDRIPYISSRKLGLAEAHTAKGRQEVGPLEILAECKGSDLLSSKYRHPFLPKGDEARPILAADYVTSDSGTGLVHTAPAHGVEDFQLCVKHGLVQGTPSKASAHSDLSGLLCPIDLDGRFTSAVAQRQPNAQFLVGVRAQNEGTALINEWLDETDCLLLEQPIQHRYAYDWRSKTPVMVMAMSQWFVDVSALKGKAHEALQKVKFIGSDQDRLGRVINSRGEWCISRQRAWGLPLPVLFDAETKEPLLTSENVKHIANVLREKGSDYWWIGNPDEFVVEQEKGRKWVKGTDTLDVWFDSGAAWLAAQSSPGNSVADLYVEGTDQHRGWFQSSLLTKVAFDPTDAHAQAPFKAVGTHGHVLNCRGEKMSKSLGNYISPNFFLKGGAKQNDPAWGADVVRFWVARAGAWGEDVRVSALTVRHAGKALFHLRNTARFLLSVRPKDPNAVPRLGDANVESGLGLLDRYILHQLSVLDKECRACYEEHDYAGVARRLSLFASSDLSSIYFSAVKKPIYAGSVQNSAHRRAILAVCDQALSTLTSILAPMAPLLAEEVWHFRNGATADPPKQTDQEEPSFFHQGWRDIPNAERWCSDEQARQTGEDVLRIRHEVFQLVEQARQAGAGKSSIEYDAYIILPTTDSSLVKSIRDHHAELDSIFSVSHVHLLAPGEEAELEAAPTVFTSEVQFGSDLFKVVLRRSSHHLCPRCRTYTSNEETKACDPCVEVMKEKGNGPRYVFDKAA